MLKQVSAGSACLSVDSDLPLFREAPNLYVCHFDRACEDLYGGGYRAWILRGLQRYDVKSKSMLPAGNRPVRLVQK